MLKQALAGLVLVLVASASWADVVGWRMDGHGAYPNATPPASWPELLWKADLQWSNSSPIVVGDRIFVCEEPTTLVCVSKNDGKKLWSKSVSYDLLSADEKAALVAAKPGLNWDMPPTQPTNGQSSATPVSDGKVVGVVFNNGMAACFELDGNMKWAKFIDKPITPSDYGSCASPQICGNVLLVHFINMVALDLDNGRQIWKAQKTKFHWGSPAFTKVGKLNVAVTGAGDVVNLANGKVLASGLAKITYGGPLVVGDTAYYVDDATCSAVKLLPRGEDGIEVKELWKANVAKDRYYASPLLCDGQLYIINQKAALTALNAADGSKVYEKRLRLGRGTIYSSITLGGKNLYMSNEDGTVSIVEPGTTYKELARTKLDPFRSCPVFEGSRIYVRTSKGMCCFGK